MKKEEMLEMIKEDEEYTKNDLQGKFSDLVPMYYIGDIPVILSTSVCEYFDISLAALVHTKSNRNYILVNILFLNYLEEDEQDVILAHEYGHYLDNKCNKKFDNLTEKEISADMCSVNYYGAEVSMRTLIKVNKMFIELYGEDEKMNELFKSRLEAMENSMKKMNRA